MDPLELAIKAAVELVRGVLSDLLSERLKPKTAHEKARHKVLKLYVELDGLVESSTEFSNAVCYVASRLIEKDPTNDEFPLPDVAARLQDPVDCIATNLRSTRKALHDLYPQLRIAETDLETILNQALSFRDATLSTILDVHGLLDRGDDELRALCSDATRNHSLLSESVEQLRGFITAQFPFDDLF